MAGLWFEYGNAAAGLRETGLAERAWQKAIEAEPRNVDLLVQIGHQYESLRRPEQARACFARAAAVAPRGIDPRISLAVLLGRQHRVSEARAAVEECLAINPRNEQARYFSAVLDRREGNFERAELQLRELITDEPKHPYVRHACRHELANILDRTDRIDEAMKLLVEAKQIVGAQTNKEVLLRNYDQAAEAASRFTSAQPRQILRRWAKTFPPEKRQVIPPLAFLVGHPRSGTTLLEQILEANSGVAALDEPSAFTAIVEAGLRKAPAPSPAQLNVLRRNYTHALLDEAGTGATGKTLVDKNPSPTARLPIWLRVFPELRVIIALRDPRDVALSCYFQNILLNTTNVNFLSLERIAKHYADLMEVWLTVREWEGFEWLETRYEDIVTDLDREGRRVTEFLGLSWQEDQSRFYENGRKQLYSPTYRDVTRPVYASSVGRWRAYEKYLAPILHTLEPYRRRLGYDSAGLDRGADHYNTQSAPLRAKRSFETPEPTPHGGSPPTLSKVGICSVTPTGLFPKEGVTR
jgi:tetratricopeptide (TPR) repeat protein